MLTVADDHDGADDDNDDDNGGDDSADVYVAVDGDVRKIGRKEDGRQEGRQKYYYNIFFLLILHSFVKPL